MKLRLGGNLRFDYRYYAEEERSDNRFDISRARLKVSGDFTRWFRFAMEYEFQGNETGHLVDAYGEMVLGLHAFRYGQFKQPFGLEWQTGDKGMFFTERSMGYSLSPKRDVGLMFHGSFHRDTVNYAAGFFNGDGDDGSSSGSEHDESEMSARLVIAPFKTLQVEWLNSFQFGGSFTQASIDTLNVSLKVKSAGMIGTQRNLYVLSHNTKFGVVQDVGDRRRLAAEMAWTWNSLAVAGEYVRLRYEDLKPAGSPPGNADFKTWYGSAVYCLTGEKPVLKGGVFVPLSPDKSFNPDEGSPGAFCLAIRSEHFRGDADWINPVSYVSVEKADASSIALSWMPFPWHRVVFDYTTTRFSDKIRVRVLPDGSVDYVEVENVLTIHFGLDF
ncbi:MAG: hypothetical protein GY866_06895 [Proteobacteria bacterium]|nr:hypothetical protein [Pseudomonadota bacterium]